jgi:hypothetical protein
MNTTAHQIEGLGTKRNANDSLGVRDPTLTTSRRNRVASRTTLAGFVMTCLSVTGCSGQDRSTEAYCQVVDDSIASMKSNLQKNSEPGAGRLLAALANYSEINRMMQLLKAVAPDEIKTDVEISAASFEEATKSAGDIGNPVGALGGILSNGLLSSASDQRVDAFTRTNCGIGLF